MNNARPLWLRLASACRQNPLCLLSITMIGFLLVATAAGWVPSDPLHSGLLVFALGMTGLLSPENTRKHEVSFSHFGTLFNSSGLAILIIRLEPDDTIGAILDANDLACELSGYTRDELIGMPALNLSAQLIDTANRIPELKARGRVCSDEVGLTRDGRRVPMEIVSHLIDFHGQPAVMVICRDVSKRIEFEKDLRQTRERFRCIFDQAPVGVALANPDGRLILVNHAFADMLGYTADQLINHTYDEWTCSSDRPTQHVQFMRLCAGEIASYNQELRLTRKDGGLIWVRVTSSAIRDNERVANVISIVENVSQEKAAQEALAAEHEVVELERRRLRAVLDILPVGVFIAGADGRIIEVNPAAQSIWGPSILANSPEDYNSHFAAWWPETGEPLTTEDWGIIRALRSGESLEGEELEIETPDGNRKRILAYALPIRDQSGRIIGAAAVNVDISLRRQVMEQLRELNETLEQRVLERTAVAEQRATQLRALAFELTRAEQRERRRIAQMLHDHHQQLLVAAKLSLSMLNRRVSRTDLNPIFHRISELLDQSIDGLRSLTVQLSPTILHDAGLAAAIEWLTRNHRGKYNLDVALELEPNSEPISEDISIFIFQAVRELLFNIIKHAQVSNARIAMSLENENFVKVIVADSGIGFDAHKLNPRGGNEGFGLFSLRERLELIGGTLTIKSAPREGTQVTMIVPRVSVHDQGSCVIPAGRATINETSGAGGRTRVLLVDDHEILREGMAALLHEYPDFEVIGEASDGVLAIEMARHTHPDVVIMDVAMPRLDGIEATRRIKAMNPAIQIIGLSMYGEENMAATMKSAGASAYLPKGCPADLLVSTIRRCVTAQQQTA